MEGYVGAGGKYDPDYGIPRELGMITSSAQPIVVNGVVVVLNSHQPGYGQTRIENVPGDVMGYDAATGKPLWKFHVIPRPGEFGNDTWHNDAWYFSGNVGQWAGASADARLGLVYLVTNNSTIQSYAGHRPGDNLFGGCVLALDVKTGQRRWHFQIHRSDQWNYDIPVPPILMDLTVDGRRIPALIQNTKQGLVFAFNRETGAPIWPIEDRPVIQTEVPGNYTSPTQPYPTLPEPLDPIVLRGLTEEFVIDYTPELKQQALKALSRFRIGGLYVPPLPYNHTHKDFINQVGCLGAGNVVSHPPVADPSNRHDVRVAQADLQRGRVPGTDQGRGCGRSELRLSRSARRCDSKRNADHGQDGRGLGAGRGRSSVATDRRPDIVEADQPTPFCRQYEHRTEAMEPAGWRDTRGAQKSPSARRTGSPIGSEQLLHPDDRRGPAGPDAGLQ